MLGRASRAAPLTLLPMVALAVCNSALVAVTSIVSETEPTSMRMLTVEVTPTFTSWALILVARKPVRVAEIVYEPGVKLEKMYWPSSLAVVLRAILVVLSTITTVAPLTAAPDGSVTTPLTVPVETACPNEIVARRRRSTKQLKTPIHTDLDTRLARGIPPTSESDFQTDPGKLGNRKNLRRRIKLWRDNVNKEVDEIFT